MSVAEIKETTGIVIISWKRDCTSYLSSPSNGILLLIHRKKTSGLLSGLVYHLLRTPQVLEKLNKEIQAVFQAQKDITLHKVAEQKYLLACFEEDLRIYPPVPIILPRVVPTCGAIVCGQFVPEGVSTQC